MTTKQPLHLTPDDYLKKILTARVYDVAMESALEPAKQLGKRLHNTVLLKREDQQPVRSFKLRGAYNKMAQLSAEQLAKGVICASAGNHAQGVALSAHKLGARAVIVMPTTTPQVKVDAVRGFGGEVVLHGDSYSDAYAHSLILQKKQGLTFVHPFDDPDVIAGQGTIAMEILRQVQTLQKRSPGSAQDPTGRPPLDAVFVAIGGGGLGDLAIRYGYQRFRPDVMLVTVIILIILVGCKKELVKEPKRLIEREKMVNIMYDLSLLEAMKVENPALMDSFKYNSNQYIYKKYKIDSVQFAQSNIYYAADYKEYEKMYNQIKARLDKEKTQVNSLMKAIAKKEMQKAKAKKKLKEKKVADSIKKAKQNLNLKKQTDSIKKANQLKASKSSDTLKKVKK